VKSVRLLPIVICAAGALLAFKAVGLVTNGGYVLSGTMVADAEEAAHGGAAAPNANGEITIPKEPTVADTSPTITDPSPTLGEPAAGHGEAAPAAHGEAPAADAHGASPSPAPAGEAGHAAEAVEPDASAPHTAEVPPAADCPVDAGALAAPGAAGEGHGEAAPAAHGASPAGGECLTLKDAEAVQEDSNGNLVPLAGEEGALATQKALLARLSERRTELDSLQTELDMRSALVDAAEKRLEERAAAVSAMEAQIGALVAQKKALDEDQLKSIIGMYETMKPKDAAAVFNTLDMEVLLRVARNMNPRKMAPIMAKMETARAEELTVQLAAIEPEPSVAKDAPTGQDITALPQIVAQ
jgi:flagellar motility protein MotE (MotC chaperone)